jgi:hypothetical protein
LDIAVAANYLLWLFWGFDDFFRAVIATRKHRHEGGQKPQQRKRQRVFFMQK